MNIAVIKKLVEEISIEDLKAAGTTMEEGETPSLQIEGKDEGEQLTHILASIWIKEDMQKNNHDVRTSIRRYSEKVRKSIS
jgi:hypothetical protein